MTSSESMNRWMADLMAASRADDVLSTSSGAGPERDYAYLHFQTKDGTHAVLVFRRSGSRNETGDDASIIVLRFEGDDEDIATRVARATQPRSAFSSAPS
jgi:hypothetical protein